MRLLHSALALACAFVGPRDRIATRYHAFSRLLRREGLAPRRVGVPRGSKKIRGGIRGLGAGCFCSIRSILVKLGWLVGM